jgi:hypothetical protein
MKYIYQIYYYFLFILKNPEKIEFHPRYNKRLKYGFTVGNRHFYRFAHDYEIFESRFRYMKTFYQEVENKLTSQDINDFSDATRKYLEDYKKSIHSKEPLPELLEKAIELQSEMKYRSEWLFEPTSLYKYASVIYFDLQEDITDYDMDYNHDKIKHWSKKKELLKVLLKELMENVEGLLTLSNESFKEYLSELQKSKNKQTALILTSSIKDTEDKKRTEVTI